MTRGWFSSVRARTALGATGVVAVALVLAGLAVVDALRGGLTDNTRLVAESRAREVAVQVAVDRIPKDAAGLDTDDPVQVVTGDGTVLASSDALAGAPPMSDAARPGPAQSDDSVGAREDDRHGGAGGGRDDDDRDDGRDDDGRDDDGRDDDRGAAGASGGADDDARAAGEVADDAVFDRVSLPVDDEGEATSDPGEAEGRADFTVAALRAEAADGTPVTVYAGSSLAVQELAVTGTVRAMLAGLPALLIVVGAVTWLVTRHALRPVEGIRAELAEITGSRDLSRRVPVPSSRDEVARLAVTTNGTLEALQESVERQRRFVADASHELRSPIASLRTQVEVAEAHPELLETGELLEDVVRLQHLAADLLLLARLDAGEGPRAARVDLAELVREETARRPEPGRAGELEEAVVAGSPGQLGRVLANLLDNAQRHARERVVARVRTEPADTVGAGGRGAGGGRGWAVLSVEDDGPGVPEGERERVFERFVRLDDARARDDGGAGLGLAIVRELVTLHGGTISLGRGPDGGALFTVRLPLAGPAGD
ncbi:sensor histidine kinase [Streptomyces fragilis]|uniref:histidine kinase n=1 Tax=Streptomyces fragilis TaxID=67301 RepID=A0ABV2YRP5_9ACTN|nr:HAMP domain-containing sensor histidine kinase [Streptomyces fragilis]